MQQSSSNSDNWINSFSTYRPQEHLMPNFRAGLNRNQLNRTSSTKRKQRSLNLN